MSRTQQILAIFSVLMIAAGIVLGAYAWQEYRQVAILVEWSTASELSTVGFNLYRSDERDGRYEKVNSALIPASPDPLAGGDYSYRDTSVAANDTYFYMLEDVDSSGAAERYGPIEVKAQRGGQIELALSGGLVLVSIFSLVNSLPPRRSPAKRAASNLPAVSETQDPVVDIKTASPPVDSEPDEATNISPAGSS